MILKYISRNLLADIYKVTKKLISNTDIDNLGLEIIKSINLTNPALAKYKIVIRITIL